MKDRKLFKKTDIFIIAAVLFIALLCVIPQLLNKEENATAVITADNKIIAEIPLHDTDNQTIKINGCVIQIENGEIFFLSSDCDDKICVKSGKISKKGDAAACVPNRVSVYIKNADNDMDAVVY